MKADKLFLKNLESSLVVLHSEDKLKIRFLKIIKRIANFEGKKWFLGGVLHFWLQSSSILNCKTR